MPAFEYTALDSAGKPQKGVLEGETARQVRQQLRDRGLLPTAVQEVEKKEEETEKIREYRQSKLEKQEASEESEYSKKPATPVSSMFGGKQGGDGEFALHLFRTLIFEKILDKNS